MILLNPILEQQWVVLKPRAIQSSKMLGDWLILIPTKAESSCRNPRRPCLRTVGQLHAGTLNEKSDVYAFGVVLLELLTAAEVVDTKRPAACQNVVDWLYSKLHDVAAIRQARPEPWRKDGKQVLAKICTHRHMNGGGEGRC